MSAKGKVPLDSENPIKERVTSIVAIKHHEQKAN